MYAKCKLLLKIILISITTICCFGFTHEFRVEENNSKTETQIETVCRRRNKKERKKEKKIRIFFLKKFLYKISSNNFCFLPFGYKPRPFDNINIPLRA